MSLNDHPRAYGAAMLSVVFAAGVVATLGFKDFYADLEWRYETRRRQRRQRRQTRPRSSRHRDSTASLASVWGFGGGPVQLEDHESDAEADGEADGKAKKGDHATQQPPAIVQSLDGTIGNTPMLELRSLSAATGCVVLAKCEHLNGAGGSPKDRVALAMIRDAEARGLLVPRSDGGKARDTIYEGTVGSTGISLAALARARGYGCHIVMPDDQSREKAELLRHLGATVERVPVAPVADARHFVNLARTRAAEHAATWGDGSRGFFADQFENPANWRAHYETTGPEVARQAHEVGGVDAFVAGAGTGGTISGVARYLKEQTRQGEPVKIVLADPQGSGLYNRVRNGVMFSLTEREGTRRRAQVDSVVEGVGINRVTGNFEAGRELVDDAVRVDDGQALRMARWLVEKEGVFVGSSSAVNCVAAVVTALGMPKGSVVVTVLCDGGGRHLSKFWKAVADLGLEGDRRANGQKADEPQPEEEDLLAVLGIEYLAQ